MVDQAIQALERAGIDEQPETVLADAGFFNTDQIDQLAARGIQPLVSPDASGRKAPGKMRRSAAFEQMRQTLQTDEGWASYRRRSQIIEPVFAHTKTIRRADRFQRRRLPACRAEWPPDRHHAQPPQALAAHQRPATGLTVGAAARSPRKQIPPTLPSPDRPPATRGLCATASPGSSLIELRGKPIVGPLPIQHSRACSRRESAASHCRRCRR